MCIICLTITPSVKTFDGSDLSTNDKIALGAALSINAILLAKIAHKNHRIYKKLPETSYTKKLATTIKQAWSNKDWEIISLLMANAILIGYGIGRVTSTDQTTHVTADEEQVELRPIPVPSEEITQKIKKQKRMKKIKINLKTMKNKLKRHHDAELFKLMTEFDMLKDN